MDAKFLSGKKVVVAGAGMAGLSFALALRKRWPSNLEPPLVTIYDRRYPGGGGREAGLQLIPGRL